MGSRESLIARRKPTWENVIISNYPKRLYHHRVKKGGKGRKKKRKSQVSKSGKDEGRKLGSFTNLPPI